MESMDEGCDKGDIRSVPRNVIKQFIETYKAHPALWQIKNKQIYGNRNLKRKALEALITVWKRHDPGADVKMVKTKIQSLRGSFRKELKKIIHSRESTKDAGDIYTTQLWYFKSMYFLVDDETPSNSFNNGDPMNLAEESASEDETSFDEESGRVEIEEVDISHGSQSKYRKGGYSYSEKSEEQEGKLFNKKVTDVLNAKLGGAEVFGQYLAARLNDIVDQEQRMLAESLMMEVLHSAIRGHLTKSTHLVHPASGSFTHTNYTSSNFLS